MTDGPNGDDRIDVAEPDALSDAECRMVAMLRAPVRAREGFDENVMAAVRWMAPVVLPRTGHSFAKLALVSLAGAALAASLALVISDVFAARPPAPSQGVAVTMPPVVVEPQVRAVRFTLVASGASQVAVAGSFNGWNVAATPLERVGDDTWTAEIPLGAGRYVYQFVIDGKRWMADPNAPRDPGDDFGATNSVVTVPAISAGRGSGSA